MTSVLKVRDYSSKVFDMVNNISFFPKLISFFFKAQQYFPDTSQLFVILILF